MLYQDFPEICHPVIELDGAPQRAGKQHIDGRLTNIVWSADDYFRLPDVHGGPYGDAGSPFGGVKMSHCGLDGAFRGINIDGDRVSYIGIDDPETEEGARSYERSVVLENKIDRDIAGLGSDEYNLGMSLATTVQTHYSFSARVTDPKTKPAWGGKRYGVFIKWPGGVDKLPDKEDDWPESAKKWLEYIALRKKDQFEGDPFGRTAVEFYIANRESMDEGAELLSQHFIPITMEDGTELVHSSIQQEWNKIADTSLEAYCTEYQNDPEEGESDKALELTPAIVANRLSGLRRNDLPSANAVISGMLDMGDRYGHWAKGAWTGNASGNVIDYGIMEVPTMATGMSGEAKEIAIYNALMDFLPSVLAVNPPDHFFIDSGDGDHTQAVYRAVMDMGETCFHPSKGWSASKFKVPKVTPQNRQDIFIVNEHCYASFQDMREKPTDPRRGVWLYNFDSEYAKHWTHLRFITPTFDEIEYAEGSKKCQPGTLSLFEPEEPRIHTAYSHHICAEKRIDRWEEGKGWVRKWLELSNNNHWLDATAGLCVTAWVAGVELVESGTPLNPIPKTVMPVRQRRKPITNQHGQPFLVTER